MEFCAYIPKATLAAVIITAVIFSVEYEIIKPMWKSKSITIRILFIGSKSSCLRDTSSECILIWNRVICMVPNSQIKLNSCNPKFEKSGCDVFHYRAWPHSWLCNIFCLSLLGFGIRDPDWSRSPAHLRPLLRCEANCSSRPKKGQINEEQ